MSKPPPDSDPTPIEHGKTPHASQESVSAMLEAMGRGDRQAAADFVARYGPQIRRRVRGKIRASMRRLFDSEDILATLARRLDRYVHTKQFTPQSEGELWSLVFTICERAVVEKARIWKVLQNETEVTDLLESPRSPAFLEPDASSDAIDRSQPLFCIVWDPEVLSEEDYAEVVGLLGDLYEAAGGASLTRVKERGFGVYSDAGVVA